MADSDRAKTSPMQMEAKTNRMDAMIELSLWVCDSKVMAGELR